jgi:hypothetical protein
MNMQLYTLQFAPCRRRRRCTRICRTRCLTRWRAYSTATCTLYRYVTRLRCSFLFVHFSASRSFIHIHIHTYSHASTYTYSKLQIASVNAESTGLFGTSLSFMPIGEPNAPTITGLLQGDSKIQSRWYKCSCNVHCCSLHSANLTINMQLFTLTIKTMPLHTPQLRSRLRRATVDDPFCTTRPRQPPSAMQRMCTRTCTSR